MHLGPFSFWHSICSFVIICTWIVRTFEINWPPTPLPDNAPFGWVWLYCAEVALTHVCYLGGSIGLLGLLIHQTTSTSPPARSQVRDRGPRRLWFFAALLAILIHSLFQDHDWGEGFISGMADEGAGENTCLGVPVHLRMQPNPN